MGAAEEQRGPLSIHPEVRIWLEETGCTCSCKAEVRARVSEVHTEAF